MFIAVWLKFFWSVVVLGFFLCLLYVCELFGVTKLVFWYCCVIDAQGRWVLCLHLFLDHCLVPMFGATLLLIVLMHVCVYNCVSECVCVCVCVHACVGACVFRILCLIFGMIYFLYTCVLCAILAKICGNGLKRRKSYVRCLCFMSVMLQLQACYVI